MAHPYFHSLSSVRKWGGTNDDYSAIHRWFDSSKSHIADARHRLVLHHQAGIELSAKIFGDSITNSDGEKVPVRNIASQHIQEDFANIPLIIDIAKTMGLFRHFNFHRTKIVLRDKLRYSEALINTLYEFFGFFANEVSPQYHNQTFAMLANSFGIFLFEQQYGEMITVEDKTYPSRLVAEKFVEVGYTTIPALYEVISKASIKPWMFRNARPLSREFDTDDNDLLEVEQEHVAYLKNISTI